MDVKLKLMVNGVELELTEKDARELGEKLIALTGGKTEVVIHTPRFSPSPWWWYQPNHYDVTWTPYTNDPGLVWQSSDNSVCLAAVNE